MSRLFIEDTTLVAIGDAIREKTGSTELIAPLDMPTAIGNISGGGGDIEVEPIIITSGNYACAGDIASKYIELFGDTVTTQDIMNATYMFLNYKNATIPFEINMSNTTSRSVNSMFAGSMIKEVPIINNMYPETMDSFFKECKYLRNIPDDYFDDWNFTRLQTYLYSNMGSIFHTCCSLRKIPEHILNSCCGLQTGYYYVLYNNGFYGCYALDEITGLGVHNAEGITSNLFYDTFTYCHRLKNIIFTLDNNGNPQVRNWSNQTMDLTKRIGYGEYNPFDPDGNAIVRYNSGITMDKRVYDDATYQALKDDPDWWTGDINYSRYNHNSAVNTINSLPDLSSGSGNVIKFQGASGSLTDGGAINTLTEAEIAVAAAKGWTVSLV